MAYDTINYANGRDGRRVNRSYTTYDYDGKPITIELDEDPSDFFG